MTRFELQPGDVVFPMSKNSTPWIVVYCGEGGQTMMYISSDGELHEWRDPEDHTFDPGVLIVRGREAVNGRWP